MASESGPPVAGAVSDVGSAPPPGEPATVEAAAKRFLRRHKEDGDMNQYWYSVPTIQAFAGEVQRAAEAHRAANVPFRAAFLSTPSVYFALPPDMLAASRFFDIDDKWATHPAFVKFDFNCAHDCFSAYEAKCKAVSEAPPSAVGDGKTEVVKEEWEGRLFGEFDFVVIDPPFITREVWEKYAAATKPLLRLSPGAGTALAAPFPPRILCTTIHENKEMMKELLEVEAVRFQPSIPNLIYQYDTYANYNSPVLDSPNSELPPPDED